MEATLEGAKLRFRPIVMTSLAFGFGVLPLALTTGAGAGAQNAIGTSVLGGMVTGTFLAVFYIPLFYFVIYRLMERKRNGQSQSAEPAAAVSPEDHRNE
jgi:multidrug efflux pump subunit AcrB